MLLPNDPPLDTSGNLRAQYSTLWRSNKPWHAVFFWILDVAAVNSFVIWCKRHNLTATRYRHISKLLKRKEFSIELVERLGCIG